MGPPGAPGRWSSDLLVDCPRHVVDVEVIAVGFREVSVVEVREVLRGWLEGARAADGRRAGGGGPQDRPTLCRGGRGCGAVPRGRARGADRRADRAVVAAVRPARPNGHGAVVGGAAGHEEQITAWVGGFELRANHDPLSVVKIEGCWPGQGCGCRIGRCTGSRSSGAASATGPPRSASPTASPGVDASRLRPARSPDRPGDRASAQGARLIFTAVCAGTCSCG